MLSRLRKYKQPNRASGKAASLLRYLTNKKYGKQVRASSVLAIAAGLLTNKVPLMPRLLLSATQKSSLPAQLFLFFTSSPFLSFSTVTRLQPLLLVLCNQLFAFLNILGYPSACVCQLQPSCILSSL